MHKTQAANYRAAAAEYAAAGNISAATALTELANRIDAIAAQQAACAS